MLRGILAVGLALAAPSAQGATPADLSKVAWMVGAWGSEQGGVVTRETWLEPVGGAMAGVTQTNRDRHPWDVEFATISAEPDGVTFTARMKMQSPVAFLMTSGAEGQVVFENMKHSYPQRIIYTRCDQDLCARIEGMVGVNMRSTEWRYHRIP